MGTWTFALGIGVCVSLQTAEEVVDRPPLADALEQCVDLLSLLLAARGYWWGMLPLARGHSMPVHREGNNACEG